MCVPKSNSNDRYAITCDVIAYHLVHFLSIWVINKCQSVIDFFLPGSAQYNSGFKKISVPSPEFHGKTLCWKWNFCKVYTLECQQGDEICFRYNKIRYFYTLERQTMGVNKYASTFPMASCNKKTCNYRRKKCGIKNKKIRKCFCKYTIEDNHVA